MDAARSSRLPKIAFTLVASLSIAGACTYDFGQFEGLAPPLGDDDAAAGRGGSAGKDASSPDGKAGQGGSSGGSAGQGGNAGSSGVGGSGGATGGSGGSGGTTGGGGGATGGSAGSTGKAGAAGSGGADTGGSGGQVPDASVDGAAGSGGAGGSVNTGGASGTGGATTGGTGGSGGATGGSGGSDGGPGGSGGHAGATGSGGNSGASGAAGSTGKGGASNADAGADVIADALSDRRDVAPDSTFDCSSVNGVVYQGHCYYARSVAVDWNTANTTTCAAPAHLATITSAGEQNVVAGLLSDQDRWIGLRRPTNSSKNESSFYWVTNETLSFRNWDVYSDADREPNYTGECVRMRFTDMWADVLCTEALAVVCERE